MSFKGCRLLYVQKVENFNQTCTSHWRQLFIHMCQEHCKSFWWTSKKRLTLNNLCCLCASAWTRYDFCHIPKPGIEKHNRTEIEHAYCYNTSIPEVTAQLEYFYAKNLHHFWVSVVSSLLYSVIPMFLSLNVTVKGVQKLCSVLGLGQVS